MAGKDNSEMDGLLDLGSSDFPDLSHDAPDARFSIDSAPSAPKQKRVSVPLNEDGSIAWDAMRGATAQKVKAAIKSVKGSEAEPVSLFTKSNTDAMYDILGGFEAQIFQRTMKLDREIALKVFPYTPQEKEILANPTIEMLNKRSPAVISDNVDIITLVGLLLQLTQAKISLARELQALRHTGNNVQPIAGVPA